MVYLLFVLKIPITLVISAYLVFSASDLVLHAQSCQKNIRFTSKIRANSR